MGGFHIYDVKDKTNPKLITFVKTHGKGVHRFDVDENYAYMSTEMEGFIGNILVIYDIRNPSKPVEVGRWWMENQNTAAGDTPHPKRTEHRLHHAMRCGNEMYAGCWMSGVSIIDVSDISKPRTLVALRIRSGLPGADPHLPQGAVPDRRPEHRGVDRGGAREPRARCRQAACAAAHLGRHRSDQAEAAVHLSRAAFGLAL